MQESLWSDLRFAEFCEIECDKTICVINRKAYEAKNVKLHMFFCLWNKMSSILLSVIQIIWSKYLTYQVKNHTISSKR